MSVKVRFSRIGRAKRPFFRIVATDSRNSRDGKFLENLGTYDPVDKKMVTVNIEAIDSWTAKGATCSDSVKRVIKKHSKTTEK